MKLGKTPKQTLHTYKGYEIIGTYYLSSGSIVLGGRHYVEGGLKRNYNIKKDGKFKVNPNDIFEKLSHVKEFIDEHLIPNENKQ